jgi:hypothetical protein
LARSIVESVANAESFEELAEGKPLVRGVGIGEDHESAGDAAADALAAKPRGQERPPPTSRRRIGVKEVADQSRGRGRILETIERIRTYESITRRKFLLLCRRAVDAREEAHRV